MFGVSTVKKKKNQHTAGREAGEAGESGEKIQPIHDLVMLQVCALKQSHSGLPGIISPLALKEAFDI